LAARYGIASARSPIPVPRIAILSRRPTRAGRRRCDSATAPHGARLPDGADAIVAAYRGSKRFVAVVQQQGRVIVDKDWHEAPPTATDRRCGVYRGVVTNNLDPLQQSRVQVDVADVPADLALWAAPCRPPGSTTVPAAGAGVWIAFEAGDPSRPVWIGVS
jgi:Type VI secretion system/phage-baseplate injector OB domain